MFGLEASLLIPFIVICLGRDVCCDKKESVQGHNMTLGGSNGENYAVHVSETADEASRNNSSTSKQYLVEYSDYMEVPNLNHQNKFVEYYNFVPKDSSQRNSTHNEFLVKKCCPWNQYFDVEEFRCVQTEEEVPYFNRYQIFLNENKTDSDYLFIDRFPNCLNTVLTVNITSNVDVNPFGIRFEDGSLFSSYCVDKDLKMPNQTVILTCRDPTDFCKKNTCFRKCCPFGESYGSSGRLCHSNNNSFKPEFYDLKTLTRDNSLSLAQTGIFFGDVCGVKGKFLLEKTKGENSYLGTDGHLFVPGLEKYHSVDEFCLEYITVKNFSGVESFLCFPKSNSYFKNSQLQFFLMSLGFIISCTFLLLTFLVYLFTPKVQNLYGKTLMCYIACLFSAYLCLAIVELGSKELNVTVCTNLGYSILFSFLSAFFWLNVMSFDIWKTFRVESCVKKSKNNKGRLQFFFYSLYAWSFPSIITGICAYVNRKPDFPYEIIKPVIGVENCWFSKKTKAIYVFFIAPISLVLTCNIFFYVQTAWKIWKVKSDVNSIEKQKTKRFSANRDQFMINGKLFIVMGITWTLEIISFFAPHPIWYLTDAANALHGVFIFAVFVLKKKILHQICQTLRSPLTRLKELTTNNSSHVVTKINFQELNAEGKTCTTSPANDETSK